MKLAAIAAASALALSLGSARAETEVVFNFPVAVGGPVTEIIDGYAKAFMAENPGIKVTPVYTGSYQDTIARTLTQIRGNDAPAMAVLLSVDTFTLYDEDVIVALDDLATTDEEKAFLTDFYPAFLANGQVGGKIWSLPFQRSTPVLYWNKAAFAEAGLDPETPPATWAEQVEFAKKLVKKDAAGAVTNWGLRIPTSGFPYWLFQGLTTANGVELMNADGNQTNFDDPAVVEALEYLVSLSKEHGVMQDGIIEWGATPQAFFEGESAMMWTTTGNLTNVRNNAPFDFGVAMLPAQKRRGAPTGGGNIFIFNAVDEATQKAAFEFAKFLTSPEIAADWSIKTGYVAVSPSAWETEAMKAYAADFPPATVARDQLEFAVAELSTHENQRVTRVLNDALQAALLGQKEPAAALADAQAEADRILSAYR
ncbi:MAG: ABC transporter substrate-binding protein [Pikeienuella sp.]|uniref:ABC transporter substrate-binding protein n=1 Tax=Pikeienuella sp. TaxID=2831957 RepID=UPI00391A7B73